MIIFSSFPAFSVKKSKTKVLRRASSTFEALCVLENISSIFLFSLDALCCVTVNHSKDF